ncbi:hypothetical protein [Xaviernesmea oryzae]|nr:hypothetical protein [Xaviernesmea oryzae]
MTVLPERLVVIDTPVAQSALWLHAVLPMARADGLIKPILQTHFPGY